MLACFLFCQLIQSEDLKSELIQQRAQIRHECFNNWTPRVIFYGCFFLLNYAVPMTRGKLLCYLTTLAESSHYLIELVID